MLFIQTFAQGLAADRAAFFILKNDYFKRMAERDVSLSKSLCNFNGRERANVAIIVAAHGDRINVRTNQQRLERRVASGASAYDVSRGINVHIKPGFFHESHGVIAALEISFRIGNAAHSALRIGAEL